MPHQIKTAAEAAQSPISLLHVATILEKELIYQVYARGRETGATVRISADPDKPSAVYIREKVDGEHRLTEYPFRSLADMKRYLNERFAS